MVKSGGAGKVYFVLYLAVVLELLIIIVERDEAEEHLLRKQKESMRIVESILSQLQAGSGTEGINTRPQDEITIPPEGSAQEIKEQYGTDIKPWRKYTVEVGVTDVSNEFKRKEAEPEKEYLARIKKYVKLANVEELEYQVFYHSTGTDPANAPKFPSEEELKRRNVDFTKFQEGQLLDVDETTEPWQFLGLKKLKLDQDATFNNLDLNNISVQAMKPVYPKESTFQIGPEFTPPEIDPDSTFFYSHEDSMKDKDATELNKRSFTVYFKPINKEGWYKLRFQSRTNRILGVRADAKMEELDDETTVNIGTVQLSVKDLRKVQKELTSKLEKYNLPDFEVLLKEGDLDRFEKGLKESKELAREEDDANEVVGKVNLYGYIAKLLAPGQSSNFDQNKGSIEFNIRVLTPKITTEKPVITIPDYNATFSEIPAVFELSISPWKGLDKNIVEGRVVDLNGATQARVQIRPLHEIADAKVSEPAKGGAAQFRAYIDKALPAGQYKILMSHKISGQETPVEAPLQVFPTNLTEESENDLTARMSIIANYGFSLIINPVPSSGGKIKSNQFRIYLNSDIDMQRPPIEGLSVSQDQKLTLFGDARTFKLRVSWIQPYSGKEIDLYPERTFEIQQKSPIINSNETNVTVNATESKITVRIQNIKVSNQVYETSDGKKINPSVSVTAKNPKVDVPGFELASEPTLEEQDGSYTMYLEMTGKLPRGEDRVKGNVTVNLNALATNPITKVSSRPASKQISAKIDKTVESKGSRRQQRR